MLVFNTLYFFQHTSSKLDRDGDGVACKIYIKRSSYSSFFFTTPFQSPSPTLPASSAVQNDLSLFRLVLLKTS
ncbi:excalibur calcium-binding domain-containing protein [Bacillus sp. UNC437CL72CviS29]|uniref:excalibur calcium-binding domain-containing protein n=1 Tax=Bacillus sp. UNC437CL72CviS29 TaxID=1340430 RepID=UPI0012DBFFB1